ncbi:SDR family NAD(P)-dependent oxidoreductase [Niabella sp. W65]|nr:SDR family NAD(P)-dependent oxidoreductase [Niabella sp. W65]MCH7368230.1 SDR family NAD(P)-dependent oxidoreductase [Niabella sp. W65]
MAGFSPIPVKNIYSASKSAVTFFSYSLRYQLKKKGVSVSCLAPGPVYTKPEIIKDTKEKLGWFGDFMEVPPARVGEFAVRKTLKRKMIIVPGKPARFTSILYVHYPADGRQASIMHWVKKTDERKYIR